MSFSEVLKEGLIFTAVDPEPESAHKSVAERRIHINPIDDHLRIKVDGFNQQIELESYEIAKPFYIGKHQLAELGMLFFMAGELDDEDSVCELLDGFNTREDELLDLAKRLRSLATTIEEWLK